MISMQPQHSQVGPDKEAVYTVSAAASLVGVHAQTLRQYDRLGLVTPSRTKGRGRRYSPGDLRKLRQVRVLTQERGVNLAGVQLALELQQEIERLEKDVAALTQSLRDAAHPTSRVFTADSAGQVRARARRDAATQNADHQSEGSGTGELLRDTGFGDWESLIRFYVKWQREAKARQEESDAGEKG